MKIMPTRRAYRRTFRRVRVYLPLLILLLVSMVLFLPLSAGWMARRAEREVRKRTGLDVSVQSLQITVAAARVDAFGVKLNGPAGGPPFGIRHVEVSGHLSGLLAGGEQWPEVVVIDSPPPIEIARGPGGVYTLQGPLQTLLDAVANLTPKAGAAPEKKRSSKSATGRTPAVVLHNLQIQIDALRSDLPPVAISIDNLEIDPRVSSDDPVRLKLSGVATADSTEDIALSGIYFPAQQRLSLRGKLTGAALPFFIPTLGNFRGSAQDISIDLNARSANADQVEGSLTLSAARFEIAQDIVGGERWSDAPLRIRLHFAYDDATRKLSVKELSFVGQEIDVAARGQIALKDDLPGEAQLSIARLPAAALALGRSELTDRLHVQVDATSSSPTLHLDLIANGPFAKPLELDSRLSFRIRDWAVSAQKIPQPINVKNIEGTISNSEVLLKDLDVEFGGMSIAASGRMPVYATAPGGAGDTVRVRANGNAEAALQLLQQLDVLPADFSYLRAPIQLDASLKARAFRDPATSRLRIEEEDRTVYARMSWLEGELGLRRFNEPIKLAAGGIRYTSGSLELQRLSASLAGINVSANGKITGDILATDGPAPFFTGDFVSSGELADVLRYVSQEVRLPDIPQDLAGHYQLTVNASGAGDRMEAAEYNARLLLEGGSATVATPYRLARVEGIGADIALDRNTLSIRRGAGHLVDEKTGGGTIEFKADGDMNHLRVEANARTRFEVLAALAPKDFSDLYTEGSLPIQGWVEARPRESLPAGPDILRRWIAFFKKPGVSINVKPDADLIVDFEGAYRQDGPVLFTPRDFPVLMTNIRGNALFTPSGIQVNDALLDLGSAKDVHVDCHVTLDHPVRVSFTASIAQLDVNEWLDGWGDREWATPPASFESRWKNDNLPHQLVQIDGHAKVQQMKFLQFTGGRMESDFEFQGWVRAPAKMSLRKFNAELYGGTARSEEIALEFPKAARPIIKTAAQFTSIDLQPFMNDLFERKQSMDGLMTGDLEFSGQLLNYPTYAGKGNYLIEKSSVVGNIILEYWKTVLQAGSTTGGKDTTIDGAVSMGDQKVFFRDMTLINRAVNITADGNVDFRAKLDFDVTASVISKRLQAIPVISIVGDLWDFVGKEIVSYRLEGTLKEPKYRVVPTVVDRLQKMTGLLRKHAAAEAPAMPAPTSTPAPPPPTKKTK
ncbi:hypothetical protein BH09SUM1_BH09SUM1_03300 [soil metagenome]